MSLARIRWCKTHGHAVLPDDDPAFCSFGEQRWKAMSCDVVDAVVYPKYHHCLDVENA